MQLATVALVDRMRDFLAGLTASWGRLATTLVVLAALALLVFSIPIVAHRLGRLFDDVDAVPEPKPAAAGRFPVAVPLLTVRVVQGLTLTAGGLALLVVWGYDEPFVRILTSDQAPPPAFERGLWTVLLVAAGFVVFDQFKRAVARFADRADPVTEHQEEIVLRVGQLTIVLTVGAAIATVWQVNLTGLLVGAGFLGIVVGFAARRTLGSAIAGFVLMFSRPFTIGDWVEVGDQEGIVTEITIFNTRLENFDGEFLIIPNDRVADQPVTNRSQKGLLRLKTDVGVDYDADPAAASEVALDAMTAVDHVAETPPPQVIPKEFGDSAIVLELRYWIDHPTPPRKWQAVSAVVTSVKAAFDDAGITIPFPQRTVSGRTDGEREAPTAAAFSEERRAGDGHDGENG